MNDRDLAEMKSRPNPYDKQLDKQSIVDSYSAEILTRLAAVSGSFEWLNDSAEDIYSDEDGEAVGVNESCRGSGATHCPDDSELR